MLLVAILACFFHGVSGACPAHSSSLNGACTADAGYYVIPTATNLARSCANGRCPTMSNVDSPNWHSFSDASCTTWGDSCLINDNTLMWSYQLASGAAEFWTAIDLGSTFNISSFKMTSRHDCCFTGSQYVEVWVGSNTVYNGAGNTLCKADLTGTLITSSNQVVTVSCGTAITGRYAILHKTMTGVSPKNELVISDLQIFPTANANFLPCPANTYSVQGGNTCLACPLHSSSPVGSSACVADAGYFSQLSFPACAPGTFSAPGATSCTVCSAGTYSSVSGASVCTGCAAGKYGVTVGATSSSACLPCAAGTYSGAAGSSACTTCGFINGFHAYSAAGASACSLYCSPGYSVGYGSYPYTCWPCPAGKYMDISHIAFTACMNCPSATYSTNVLASSSCTSCAPGTYSNSAGNSVCSVCSVGEYSPAASYGCTWCQTGTYASSTGSSACTQCEYGKWQDNRHQTMCFNCYAGYYIPVRGAIGWNTYQCSGNTYSAAGASVCTTCPTGTTANTYHTACV
jgi:hypothetical protein